MNNYSTTNYVLQHTMGSKLERKWNKYTYLATQIKSNVYLKFFLHSKVHFRTRSRYVCLKHFKKSFNFSIFDLAHCETTQSKISSTHTYVKAPSIILFYFRSCKIYVQIREVPIFQPFCFFPQKSHYYAYSMEITVIFPQSAVWGPKAT